MISSSLVISQLATLVTSKVEAKLQKFGVRSLFANTGLDKLQKSLSNMNYKMFTSHFHLLSLLVSEGGILHFATTYEVSYYQPITNLPLQASPIPLYDIGMVSLGLSIGFNILDGAETSWKWVRGSYYGESNLVFGYLATTLRAKLKKREKLIGIIN